eukprot:452057-Rhodomonas_salina.1
MIQVFVTLALQVDRTQMTCSLLTVQHQQKHWPGPTDGTWVFCVAGEVSPGGPRIKGRKAAVPQAPGPGRPGAAKLTTCINTINNCSKHSAARKNGEFHLNTLVPGYPGTWYCNRRANTGISTSRNTTGSRLAEHAIPNLEVLEVEP